MFYFDFFQANSGKPHESDLFLADIISYYVRMGQQPVYFNIYYIKVRMNDFYVVSFFQL